VLDKVLDLLLGIVRAARGLIILIDENSGALEVRTSRGVEKETAQDARTTARASSRPRRGQSILSTDAGAGRALQPLEEHLPLPDQVAHVRPSQGAGTDRSGPSTSTAGNTGRIFTRDDLSFLEAAASQAAVGIENARQYEQLAAENERLKRAAQERLPVRELRRQQPRDAQGLRHDGARRGLAASRADPGGERNRQGARRAGAPLQLPRRARCSCPRTAAAIPERSSRASSFGYVQGAFTGADRDKKGLYEMADGGTLFLDEIGDMPVAMQAKLLRVLQDGEYRPDRRKEARKASCGSSRRPTPTSARRIADGRFREDLYYRLNVISIALPPCACARRTSRRSRRTSSRRRRATGASRMTIDDDLMALWSAITGRQRAPARERDRAARRARRNPRG
jgi:hypothetical protein